METQSIHTPTKLEIALEFDRIVTAIEDLAYPGYYDANAVIAANLAVEALNAYLRTLSRDDSRLYLMRNITATEPTPSDWVSDLWPADQQTTWAS